jgi:hypothetical protein
MIGDLSVRHIMFNRAIGSMLAPYYNAPHSATVGAQRLCA